MKKKLNKLSSKLTGYHLTKSEVDKVTSLFSTKWLKSLGIKTVIDVGANSGQFARSVRLAMPNVKIISFEPIPDECEKIRAIFKGDENFELFQYALGKERSKTKFLVNEFSPTSSLLEQTELQSEYYPVTGESHEIDVQIERLDQVLKANELKGAVLLKIDVQGFEDQVILGSESLLEVVDVIYIECSFKEFYKGQPLFNEIYSMLYGYGYEFRGVGDQLMSGEIGEPTQIDAIFVKSTR